MNARVGLKPLTVWVLSTFLCVAGCDWSPDLSGLELFGPADTGGGGGSYSLLPAVSAPKLVHAVPGDTTTFRVTSYNAATVEADLSGLPAGNNARLDVDGYSTDRTFWWTPALDDTGSFVVVFYARNTFGASSASTTISVTEDRPNAGE